MSNGSKPDREQAVAAIRCAALLAVTACHQLDGSSDSLDLWLVAGAAYTLLSTFHPLRWQMPRAASVMVVLDTLYITGLIALTGRSEYMLLYYLPILLASVRLNFLEAVRACVLAALGLGSVVVLRGQALSFTSSPLMQVYLFAASALVLAGFFYALKQATVRQQEVAGQLENALQRLSAVHEIARSGHGPDGLRQLANTTAALATRLAGADCGYLALIDPGGKLTVQAAHLARRPESHLAFDPEVAHQCVVHLAPVMKRVQWQDRQEYTVAAVPLVSNSQPIGVLQVIRCSSRSLKAREVELLRALCAEAAVTIESARLCDQIYALAAVDKLTGLYVADEFKRLVAQAMVECASQPLAMLLFDLDGSKETVSHYGPTLLEEQVTVFADIIRRGVRERDLVGRLGDDEFGLLLVDCNADGARAAASRLRQAFSRRTFHAEEDTALTGSVCCGIAAVGPGEAPEDPLSLLSRAASALAAARGQGSNQMRLWEPQEDASLPGQISRLLSGSQDSWK